MSTSSSKPADENTPLLTQVDPTPITEDQSIDPSSQQDDIEEEDQDRPLPKAQIFLLCFTVCVAPISFFSIFPYINFMIERVGNVDKEDVGFYSGLIESLFSATQMCVMILWGKVSNFQRVGYGTAVYQLFLSCYGEKSNADMATRLLTDTGENRCSSYPC